MTPHATRVAVFPEIGPATSMAVARQVPGQSLLRRLQAAFAIPRAVPEDDWGMGALPGGYGARASR